jgi:hypothetical protein
MPWENFKIWRGKLPHWRADNVTYYATFRHRRALTEAECKILYRNLVRTEGRRFHLEILCVLPEATEMIFAVLPNSKGENYELSKVIETAKRKAGKTIIENTGERFPPFYEESFDRIIRDDAELEERFEAILDSPVSAELAEDPEDYSWLFVAHHE